MSSANSPRCDCGTFAIGLCPQCGRAVCGDHSRLVAGARLCLDCYPQREREESAAERERQKAATRQAQASLDARNAAIQAISEPIERLLTAMGTLKSYSGGEVFGSTSSGGLVGDWRGEIAAICPSLVSSAGEVAYDSEAVARWFARRAAESGLPSTTFALIVERKRFLRGYQNATEVPVRAWSFPHAIEQATRWGSAPASTLYILEDGRMLTPRPTSAAGVDGPSKQVAKLPPVILKRMASTLGLTPAVSN
jgi:hypothetical protein